MEVNEQVDVSFSCVCPVIDREFRHYIVKVAVDPRGDSRADPQTEQNSKFYATFSERNIRKALFCYPSSL